MIFQVREERLKIKNDNFLTKDCTVKHFLSLRLRLVSRLISDRSFHPKLYLSINVKRQKKKTKGEDKDFLREFYPCVLLVQKSRAKVIKNEQHFHTVLLQLKIKSESLYRVNDPRGNENFSRSVKAKREREK